jgi:uncharacterized protein YkwD
MLHSILLVAMIAVATSGIAPAPHGGRTPITPETVLAEMNRVRALAGIGTFREDPRLRAAADDRMKDMLELAYWSHQSPDGNSPFVFVTPRGYRHRELGENLASGFESAELLVASWMESKGRRENMMNPAFTDVGIAVIDGSTTKRAAGRSVVVIFGREIVAEPIRRRAATDRSPAPTPSGRR